MLCTIPGLISACLNVLYHPGLISACLHSQYHSRSKLIPGLVSARLHVLLCITPGLNSSQASCSALYHPRPHHISASQHVLLCLMTWLHNNTPPRRHEVPVPILERRRLALQHSPCGYDTLVSLPTSFPQMQALFMTWTTSSLAHRT